MNFACNNARWGTPKHDRIANENLGNGKPIERVIGRGETAYLQPPGVANCCAEASNAVVEARTYPDNW
jgi:hypothetical protein